MDDEVKRLVEIQSEWNKNQDKINNLHNQQLDIILLYLKNLRERIEKLENKEEP